MDPLHHLRREDPEAKGGGVIPIQPLILDPLINGGVSGAADRRACPPPGLLRAKPQVPLHSVVRGLLFFFSIHLHHLNPACILHITNFITFWECFLGAAPHFDLF